MNKKHTLFISDLHLSEAHPKTTEAFCLFLENISHSTEALYILGDFFDLWIGDDDRSPFNERIKNTLLKYTSNGLPVYFLNGNRDFFIGKRFAKETGLTLLKEPALINLYNQRTLLMHGDSLCTLDQRHQKSRKRMHNRFYQQLVLMLPLRVRRYYGSRFRSNSLERKSLLPEYIMDVSQEEVIRVMSQYQTTTLIHGHTHRPGIHSFQLNGQNARRIVLGAWDNTARYLRVDPTGEAHLLGISELKAPQ